MLRNLQILSSMRFRIETNFSTNDLDSKKMINKNDKRVVSRESDRRHGSIPETLSKFPVEAARINPLPRNRVGKMGEDSIF